MTNLHYDIQIRTKCPLFYKNKSKNNVKVLTCKLKLSFPAYLKFCICSTTFLYFAIMIWKTTVKLNLLFGLEKQNAQENHLVFALSSELYHSSFIIWKNRQKNLFETWKPCKIAKIIVIRNRKTSAVTMQNWTPQWTFNRLSHEEKSWKNVG